MGQADEMAFGLQQEPELWLPDIEEFLLRWRTGRKALAILQPDTYTTLQQRGIPMRVLAQDPRRVIVSNQLLP